MTLESSLWTWLKQAREKLRDLHMNRVENVIAGGMPDVEGKLQGGRQFWIELKVAIRVPVLPSTVVRFRTRDKQSTWLRRRWLVGGNAFMLLQVGPERFLIPGREAEKVHLAELTLADLRFKSWLDPSRPVTPAAVIQAASVEWE